MSGFSTSVANVATKMLAYVNPSAADGFARWYGNQCILHPQWLKPISWTKTVQTTFGALIRSRFHESLGRQLILNKIHEPIITQRITESLNPGSVFVDVGANIGYYTLLASKMVGSDGLVLAFEPSHRNLADLALNLSLNSAENVLLFSTALSNGYSLARVSLPWDINSGVCSLGDGPSAHGEDVFDKGFNSVLTVALDDIDLGDQVVGRKGVVKIDAEGHEPQVVDGMKGVLSRNDFAVVCELSDKTKDHVIDVLRGLGYQGSVEGSGKWEPLNSSRCEGLCNVWFQRNNVH